MNMSTIDLNLLHVLHAVLQERSATRAAKRLRVTQSAVSNALGRLRQLFGDPLVVRTARGLAPTPRALALQPELVAVMAALSGLVSGDAGFDAATTTREFTLACADYCGVMLAPALAALLRDRAPGATLRLVTLEQLIGTEGLASNIDVHVGMPPRLPSGCKWTPLFADRFVCLVRAGRGTPGTRMPLKEYTRAMHVRVSVLGSTVDPIDIALREKRSSRRIALTVPQFSIVPGIIERTGYIATLSRRLAEFQAENFDVALREPPVSLGEKVTRMVWHERTDIDEGARFFRALVREVAPRHAF
jgi:DNA-binding transcriptional LysR family regulator